MTNLPEWAAELLEKLPPMLGRLEAADVCRVNFKTVDRAAKAGKLVAVRLGDRVVFPRSSVVAWLVANARTEARAS